MFKAKSNPPIHEHQMLAEEYKAIHCEEPSNYNDWKSHNKERLEKLRQNAGKRSDFEEIDAEMMREIIKDMHDAERSALCISGGGIRSATFALGVLQGLARKKLLGRFHYLSTVSGGGYIGSWLTAWLHHETSPGEEAGYFAKSEQGWEQNRHTAVECVQLQLTQALDVAKQDDRHKNNCFGRNPSPLHPEPKPLEHLRAYSNYLSPRLGFLSGDSWTLVSIYVRNLILNWLVIVPWLFLVLLLPRLGTQLLRWSPRQWNDHGMEELIKGLQVLPWSDSLCAKLASLHFIPWQVGCYGIFGLAILVAAGGMLYAIGYMAGHLPGGRKHMERDKNAQGKFILNCLFPLFVAGCALTCLTYWNIEEGIVKEQAHVYEIMIVFGALVHLGPAFHDLLRKGRWVDWLAVCLSGIIGGALWAWLFYQCIEEIDGKPEDFACFGVGLFFASFLIGMTVYIGMASYVSKKTDSIRKCATDADREWWARAAGWVLLFGLGWIALAALSLYGPRFLSLGLKQISAVGGVSGLVTVLLGFSSKSGGKQESAEKPGLAAAIAAKAPELAAPVFLVFLLILVSMATTLLVYHFDEGIHSRIASAEKAERNEQVGKAEESLVEDATNEGVAIRFQHEVIKDGGSLKTYETKQHDAQKNDGKQGKIELSSKEKVTWKETQAAQSSIPWLPPGYSHHEQVVKQESWWILWFLFLGILALAECASFFVNVNVFSMHGMYRDRLIRAYLAASRPDDKRKENPFTGFDPDDNLPMFALWPQNEEHEADAENRKLPGRRLFHIINTALNLVSGEKLAWQERMAASFSVTPLHCGSADLMDGYGYRCTVASDDKGKLSESGRYGGDKGISLGTAMTISGAAVNSNWGYHSSPVVTFLLTLFNARLGWWLGNPSGKGNATYDRWFPRFGIDTMFHEAFGLTNEEYSYVDLSDGGHFDNMGLYEMVRRRCHIIVLIDAEADGDYTYEGLGMAIRKIRIDFGIPIEFSDDNLLFKPKDQDKGEFRPVASEKSVPRCAIGTIRYSAMDKTEEKEDGVLLYIKPVCYGTEANEPRDVVQYKRSNPTFPHESTVDQFFTESQFESYRMLGEFTADQILNHLPPVAGIDAQQREKLETFFHEKATS